MSYCFQWDFCLCKDGRTELCFTTALCFVCYLQFPNFYSKQGQDTRLREQMSSCRTGACSFLWYRQRRNPSSAEIGGKTPQLQQSWLSTAGHAWSPCCLPQHPATPQGPSHIKPVVLVPTGTLLWWVSHLGTRLLLPHAELPSGWSPSPATSPKSDWRETGPKAVQTLTPVLGTTLR